MTKFQPTATIEVPPCSAASFDLRAVGSHVKGEGSRRNRNRAFRVSAFVALLALSACVAPVDSAKAPGVEISMAANYQQVYANILRGARNCLSPGLTIFPMQGTYNVEGQLYSELGYGEVIIGSVGGIPFTIATARVTKTGSGATLKIIADYGLGYVRESWRNSITSWANGELMCDQPRS